MLVDRKVVNDRLHRERQGILEIAFGGLHDRQNSVLAGLFLPWLEDKTHAAARHTAQHPKAPKVRPELSTCALDHRLSVEVAGPGDYCLDRTEKVAGGAGATPPHVPLP